MKKSFIYPLLLALSLGGVTTVVVAAANTAQSAAPRPADVQGGAYIVEPLHTRVQFTVSHMGFTDWYGEFTGVSGTLDLNPLLPSASKVDITIPASSISTTNDKLDSELKSAQWLGTEQYPEIRFVSQKVVPSGSGRAKIFGTLTFHGVSNPVVLNTNFYGAGVNPLDKSYTVGFNASTSLKRSDYGVAAYVPLIGDDVTLRISAAFVRKG